MRVIHSHEINPDRQQVQSTQVKILHVGDLVIDVEACSVSRDGIVLDLPDLSYRLLLSLVHHAPHRVSKDQLIEEVWQGIVVSDETLSQRIRLLRQALSDDRERQRYITSIRNQGYRLVVDVSAGPARKSGVRLSFGLKSLLLIAVIILIGLGIFNTIRILPPADSAVERTHTLAVLPFADLSQNGDNRYFSDGVHEELLSRLSQIENFGVVSRTSVLPFRSTDLSIPEIARQLDVVNILEGSVRLMGNRVRITAQLIDGKSDRHIWSQTFERELTMENLFAIQAEVANNIAGALEIELSVTDRSLMVNLPTDNLDAYDNYLLGKYHTYRLTEDDLTQAVEFLVRAIEIDDGFAEAWAILGRAYSFQGSGYGNLPPDDAYSKAREAALRALTLNSELADAHSLYADILTWYDWDWAAAEREYKATLELDPFNLLGYALLLSTQLRHAEAIELVERLISRFPDDEYIHSNAAWRYLNARDYTGAIEHAVMAGGHADARGVKGWAQLSTGRIQAALELFQQDVAENPGIPVYLSNLAIAYFRNGDDQSGQETFDKLLLMAKSDFISPDIIAAVYFEQDKADEGFEWLNKALEVRSRGLIFLQVDHVYDRFRTDPRYLDLLNKMGFGQMGIGQSGTESSARVGGTKLKKPFN